VRRVLGGWLWVAGAPVRAGATGLIRLYQLTLGGLAVGRCRFYPSCSHYAVAAIRQCGVVRGLGLAAWRILRCSPLSKGGVDYPPEGPGSVLPVYDVDIQQDKAGSRERASA
jgi:putative membrane protein insertion efficiency factor